MSGALLTTARQRVLITTPSFVPDEPLRPAAWHGWLIHCSSVKHGLPGVGFHPIGMAKPFMEDQQNSVPQRGVFIPLP
jgi:hypothetical protein